MKKIIVMFALMMGVMISANAQSAIVDNGTAKDNWYITVGVGTQLWNNSQSWTVFNPVKDQQLHINFGVGKYFNPYVGTELNYNALFNTGAESNFIDGHNLSANVALNLSNILGGYKGHTRVVEVELLAGPGWNHTFQTGKDLNALTVRGAVRVDFRVAKNLFVELTPEYVWTVKNVADAVANGHGFNLSVGVKWNIPTRRGGFPYCKLYNQSEIDCLNGKVTDLRNALCDANARCAALEDALRNASTAVVVEKDVEVVPQNVGTVLFAQGSAKLEDASLGNVAELLKNTNGTITLTGMTSPEGSEALNKNLGYERAETVKNALVAQGIPADRIVINNTYANKRSVIITVE